MTSMVVGFSRCGPPARCNAVRHQRCRRINPEVGWRIAAVGRTTQFVPAIPYTADFHLAPRESSFADNAKALVIQRIPFSDSVLRAEDREPIIKFEMRAHSQPVCSLQKNAQSGRRLSVESVKTLDPV